MTNRDTVAEWFWTQEFTVEGIVFRGLPTDGLLNENGHDGDKSFRYWRQVSTSCDLVLFGVDQHQKMDERGIGWGLKSWESVNPPAGLSASLIDYTDDRYDQRASAAMLAALVHSEHIPVLYRSQVASLLWERFGVLRMRADAGLLWRLMRAIGDSPPTSAADALDLLHELDFSAEHRYRASVLSSEWSQWTSPVPTIPTAARPEVWENARHQHFESFDLSDQGLVKLHLRGRRLDPNDKHDLPKIIREDPQLVQDLGCLYPAGCTYGPEQPWCPEEGVVSPYRAADGSRRALCLSHGQAEIFAHDILMLSFEVLKKISDSGGYAVLGARVERLTAASQLCQGQGCFGYAHTLITSEQSANCGG